jgi:hypothetical protein
MEHGTEWVGESWDELKYIRQVRLGHLPACWLVQQQRTEQGTTYAWSATLTLVSHFPALMPEPSCAHPAQAVTFLVIGNKPKKTLDDITRDLCPVLSIQQLYRISTMYWDDKYNTETVSSEVRLGLGLMWPQHSGTECACACLLTLAAFLQLHDSSCAVVCYPRRCLAA